MTRQSLIILILILTSCKAKKDLPVAIEEMEIPPGTVKVGKNLFVDKTEVTNFSYLEYTYWVGRHYGFKSSEYTKAYPDTVSWNTIRENYTSFQNYHQHVAYREFPVVCINYEQALDFCKWRSNRVMEFILIREGIIKHRPVCPIDSIFTIEKYFAGKYYNIKPNPYLTNYPDYTLPDTSFYKMLTPFADSLNAINSKKCRDDKFCGVELFTCNCLENVKLYQNSDLLQSTRCYKCKKDVIVHLKGNAMELTSKKGIGFGGSFNEGCETVARQNFYKIDTLNYFVGFRNVCSWRAWK
jgi:hypothetical protein